jgi:hypothetical protein
MQPVETQRVEAFLHKWVGSECNESAKPRDQLTAIRDLLRTTSGEWTAKQLAAQFRGFSTARATTQQNRITAITENLERLEWFGLVISDQREGITYWQVAEEVKVA